MILWLDFENWLRISDLTINSALAEIKLKLVGESTLSRRLSGSLQPTCYIIDQRLVLSRWQREGTIRQTRVSLETQLPARRFCQDNPICLPFVEGRRRSMRPSPRHLRASPWPSDSEETQICGRSVHNAKGHSADSSLVLHLQEPSREGFCSEITSLSIERSKILELERIRWKSNWNEKAQLRVEVDWVVVGQTEIFCGILHICTS